MGEGAESSGTRGPAQGAAGVGPEGPEWKLVKANLHRRDYARLLAYKRNQRMMRTADAVRSLIRAGLAGAGH